MARKGSWSSLGREKLQSSGLTTDIADKLGMSETPSAKLVDQSFDARAALVIPYFDFDGKPLSGRSKWPAFYRVRYLEKDASFNSVNGEKEQRYAQPPRTLACAYFPQTVDWKTIATDPTYELVITEGELKAAAASFMGFPTIGLGGVWSFQTKKDGYFFLPELEEINWVRRTVYICYDSDYASNFQVVQAINKIAEELDERGALVKVLLLPNVVEGGKTGLDDYFLANSTDDFMGLLATADAIGIGRALWRVNEDILYVEDPGLIVVEESGQKLSPDNFKSHSRWATASTVELKVGAEGVILHNKVAAAPAWIKWPFRRSARRLTYSPGEPAITEAGDFNQWKGWGVTPRKGDVKPWLDLSKFIFAGATPKDLEYFYDWCAYPIQNPGVKMFVGVVIHGLMQGTGKTLVGYTLGEVYGNDNWKEIKDEDLEESYWAENKQFILGDEVSGKDNRQYANTLKRLITSRNIDINIKFIPQYTLPNRMNFLFTSQHADSFFLEDNDRRFFVVEVEDEPLPLPFYEAYRAWLWEDGGAAALMHWLLERKVTKGFSHTAPAPKTQAKERMIASGKGDLATWVSDLMKFPEQTLRIGQMRHARDLFTAKELLDLYNNEHGGASKVTAVGLGRALAAAGAIQVSGGNPLNGVDGKQARFWAVRNVKTWKKCNDRKVMEKNIQAPMVREQSK